MAIDKRLTNTNGVLEKNAVTYPRTGNIMAMYPLDKSVVKAENGMLLGVDYAGKKITYPTSTSDAIMILDSAEKEYNQFVPGFEEQLVGTKAGESNCTWIKSTLLNSRLWLYAKIRKIRSK